MHNDSTPYISFDRAVEFYDSTRQLPVECLRAASKLIAEDGGITGGAPFLDAGVGTGRFARYLQDQDMSVVGVDISERMMDEAKLYCPNVAFIRADLRSIPLQSQSVQGALTVHILHLIADWRGVINEIRRVLRPGAKYYLGGEVGPKMPTRLMYFKLAEELGYNRPSVGASSFRAILEHLGATGAIINRLDHQSFRWQSSIETGALLQVIRGNPYSHLWHLSEQQHAYLVEKLEDRLRTDGISFDNIETTEADFNLWSIQWD